MIRRPNWDSSKVIAATMQQTGGGFVASQIGVSRALKLTRDRITRQPKLAAGRESPQAANRSAFNITRIARRAACRDCPCAHRRRFRGHRGEDAASCPLLPVSTWMRRAITFPCDKPGNNAWEGPRDRDRAGGLRYNAKNMLAAASDRGLTVDFVPVE